MSVAVRAAGPGDERALARLNGFVQELHVANRPGDFKATDIEDVAAWFALRMERPTVLIRIAEGAGRAIGYVLAFVHERAETPFAPARHWCEIDQVAVDPGWRRQGVARALIQTVVAEARARGIDDVELSSWTFNAGAHEAFRHLGFVPKVVRFELLRPG